MISCLFYVDNEVCKVAITYLCTFLWCDNFVRYYMMSGTENGLVTQKLQFDNMKTISIDLKIRDQFFNIISRESGDLSSFDCTSSPILHFTNKWLRPFDSQGI